MTLQCCYYSWTTLQIPTLYNVDYILQKMVHCRHVNTDISEILESKPAWQNFVEWKFSYHGNCNQQKNHNLLAWRLKSVEYM